ncbi:MAG: hypothetical protein [Microvirus sp.]|nr:MAG: hypothetical protein [Microvirus sp.]
MKIIERTHPNGDIEYVTPVLFTDPDTGETTETTDLKRVPDYVLNLVNGREIVSDVSMALDTQLDNGQPYPTSMRDIMARYEPEQNRQGYFDADDPDTDIDESDFEELGEVSEHELRYKDAYQRLEITRQQSQEDVEARKEKVDKDLIQERIEAAERPFKKEVEKTDE